MQAMMTGNLNAELDESKMTPVLLHQALEELQKSNELFETIFSSIHTCIAYLDQNYQIVRVNRAFADAEGQEPGFFIGKSFLEVFHSEPDQQLLEQTMTTGQPHYVFEQPFIARHNVLRGSTFWDWSVQPVRDASDQVSGLVIIAMNVTDRKKAQQNLAESEAQFRYMIDEAQLGIVLQNQAGLIIQCNPTFARLIGDSPQALIGRPLNEITHPEDVERDKAFYAALLKGELPRVQSETRYFRKDGQILWGRVTASILHIPQSTFTEVFYVIEDITFQRQLEAELNEVRRHLMHNREMERLQIAQDLHDGPMQELAGLIFSLRDVLGMVREKEAQEKVEAITLSLQEQIRSLRAYLSELRPPALAPFGLEKAIRSHAQNFRSKHPDLDIHLDLIPDGQRLPNNVRLAMFRIYQELLNNVVRHAQARTVFIQFLILPDQAILEVEDDGVGFNVPDRWIKIAREGHFGLIGMHERAQSVNGSVDLDSRPGHGTRVRVTIPYEIE